MPNARFASYKDTLRLISARTGATLPSLILSFGILHEITAVVPLVGVFYGARSLGIGERVIETIINGDDSSDSSHHTYISCAKTTMRVWVEEGDKWAARVGRRYGVFGYEKRQPGDTDGSQMVPVAGHISGDIANAILAYGATKALLPLRLGVSLYLSPAFARRIIEPIRRFVVFPFRRGA
ncbi:hypothetical protein AX17_004558 [Amanita inopinata Kibby_2008]|nr:hypothetical protein AX17_004558 [Amanita inopinata Kibby_2008]